MIRTNIFNETAARKIIANKGPFTVIEYDRDLSVDEENAMQLYYASKMNVRKRQLIAELKDSGVVVQSGAMQLMMGELKASSNMRNPGNLLKNVVGSKVTGESAIKPRYHGDGVLVLEPVYKFILLEDVSEWGGGIVIEDGLFLACEDTVENRIISRTTLSSAVLGGEGLFNTLLEGVGVVALESPVPMEELVMVELVDDVLKIDGNMVIAWSGALKFTVEKTTKTIVGSAVSGEGFVNVYRGSGRVLIASVVK